MSPLGHFTELIPHRVVAEVRVIAEAQRKTSGAIKRLAVFLDSATKALWQHLSNSESVLLEKLADERRQNSILATLFQEKNNECQDLKETLTLENARLSETLRQTLAEHPEAARLSAAVSAKDATILRLEQKLQAQEDRAATEGRQFTEKMKDMLQQQETMFRHTIEEIIGQTRRDAAGDLDKERIQGLLRQEQLRLPRSRQGAEGGQGKDLRNGRGRPPTFDADEVPRRDARERQAKRNTAQRARSGST